jgi:hypothetical protein
MNKSLKVLIKMGFKMGLAVGMFYFLFVSGWFTLVILICTGKDMFATIFFITAIVVIFILWLHHNWKQAKRMVRR